MHFQQDHQPDFGFNYHEPQELVPEYLPEVVSPCFIDTSVGIAYAKQSWLKRMLTLPKIAIFLFEGLDKVTTFSNDILSSVKKVESRIAVLEGSQGDFRLLDDRLQKVEMNAGSISELKLQLQDVVRKNRILSLGMITMVLLNLGLLGYLLAKNLN